MDLAISFSLESFAKLLSLKHVLISLSFEKLLSFDATVIGIVNPYLPWMFFSVDYLRGVLGGS